MWPLLVLGGLLAPCVSASCQTIVVDLCRGMGYNLTSMPNLVGHDTQADADFTLQTFSPLVQYGCSAQLDFFLCSVYVPMCNEKVAAPIGPCRGLCESVRARCYPVLQGFGFPWPAALDCSEFPVRNDHEHMCMEGPGEVGLGAVPARPLGPVPLEAPCSRYARPTMYVPAVRPGRCLQFCEADILFTRLDKDVADVWITVLSASCFVTSLFAVLTFLMDSGSRNSGFPYPERPLPFLALCYNMVSIGWGLRSVLGRDAIACYPDLHAHSRTLLLSQEGLGNAHCALVFFLTYYFGNAAAIWWIVLVTCRFLSQGLGWSHDRIQPHAPIFHLLSWGIPACLTIAVLILRYVDADELTGICSVGNQDTWSLLMFVVAPQSICLVVGTSMLLLGVVSHSPGVWASTLVTTLYILPSAAVLATNCYQYLGHDDWVLSLAPSSSPRSQPHAFLSVFLFRFFVTLSVGTAVSVWICLPKSRQIWKTILCPAEPYKKPPLTPIKCKQNNFYYYKPPKIHRVHRNHRKHKGKNGNETLV